MRYKPRAEVEAERAAKERKAAGAFVAVVVCLGLVAAIVVKARQPDRVEDDLSKPFREAIELTKHPDPDDAFWITPEGVAMWRKIRAGYESGGGRVESETVASDPAPVASRPEDVHVAQEEAGYESGTRTVNVKGYYRKDGTWVAPHTRTVKATHGTRHGGGR